MDDFVTPGEVGLAQRERVIFIGQTVFTELLLTHWNDSDAEALIPKDSVRKHLFALLADSVPMRELVELMLEQVVDDYSVFGWDIEEQDTMFVFSPIAKD